MHGLYLKINIGHCKNIELLDRFPCDPYCSIYFNNYQEQQVSQQLSLNRVVQSIVLKFPIYPTDDTIHLVLFDLVKDDSGKQQSQIYIGELQLSILDIFKGNNNLTVLNQDFQLHDSLLQRDHFNRFNETKPFIVGTISLGFQLLNHHKRLDQNISKNFKIWQRNLNQNLLWKSHRTLEYTTTKRSAYTSPVLPSTPTIKINDSEIDLQDDDDDEDEEDEFSDNEIDSTNKAIDSTNLSNLEFGSLISALDEYDVVTDTNEVINILSSDDEDEDDDDDEIIDQSSMDQFVFDNKSSNEKLRLAYLCDNDKNSSTNSFVDESDYDSSNELSTNDKNPKNNKNSNTDNSNSSGGGGGSFIFKPKGSKLSRLTKNTRKKYYTKNKLYHLINKDNLNFKIAMRQHSLGIISLQLINIVNLPHLTNKLSKKKYLMDPFIITIFGRRVFKSSCKKNSLNPTFNEFLSLELFPHEENFDFIFKIFDKDSFSFHDEIAEYHLSWYDIQNRLLERQKNNIQYIKNPQNWEIWELPLLLNNNNINISNTNNNTNFTAPILKVKINFTPYKFLKHFFWSRFISTITIKPRFDLVDLLLIFDKLGSFIDKDIIDFFARFNKLPWRGDQLTKDQLINGLETWKRISEFKEIWQCPKCFKTKISSNHILKKSKIYPINDIITHFAICDFEHQHKSLKPSYVSSAFASKRWFSKILIKMSYGKYALGSNNANILVQDRNTGIVLEEKISAHVKLGMRVIYNGRSKNTKKFKKLLKRLSIKQGKKFDNPISVKQIEPFIRFHQLDMTDCLDVEYKTFNEFFYRKLKPGSRMIESNSPNVMISPTDSRCTVFASIGKSKQIWIKSNKFTLAKLTGGYHHGTIFRNDNTSIAIFRLAPQDYHRFHSPCDVTIGKPIYIKGEYYTVNPMAVRSQLDVFGENVRIVIPMKSESFGEFLMIPVGAMMVGSIILTVKEGDTIVKGDEIGYFKFGGSTVILVVLQDKIKFDSDLVNNSTEQIETLVSMGMTIGHTPDVEEVVRRHNVHTSSKQIEKIKRRISVSADTLSNTTWEFETLKKLLHDDVGDDNIVTIEEKVK